jgi:flagella basal body P-ring formation protein FlgA
MTPEIPLLCAPQSLFAAMGVALCLAATPADANSAATPATTPAPEVSAAAPLKAGKILDASDLEVPEEADQAAQALIGMSLKRSVGAGAPIAATDVGPPLLVARNALVQMEFVRGALSISAEGRALSAGARGERIKVQNTSSRLAVTALVVGHNRVEVER